jgi:hypothetical protein
MKKVGIILGTVALLVVVAVLALMGNLDHILASAIRQFGPPITQTTVEVKEVHLSARQGTGTIIGLDVGNPAPFKEPYALRLGEASISLDPSTLMHEKTVVKSIRIAAPEITIEGGLQDNNLKTLANNIDHYSASEKSQPETDSGAKKKLQVDEFVLSNAKVNVKVSYLGVGGADTTLIIPEIRLGGLGSGPEGITPADLSKALLNQIIAQVTPAVTSKLGQMATDQAGKAAAGAIKDATKGLDGLLKKKN